MKKQTSRNAPMRGKTLVSHLMRLTNSFETGELKNTYALKPKEKKEEKSIRNDQETRN